MKLIMYLLTVFPGAGTGSREVLVGWLAVTACFACVAAIVQAAPASEVELFFFGF